MNGSGICLKKVFLFQALILWGLLTSAQPTPNAYNQWAFGSNVAWDATTQTNVGVGSGIFSQEGCASYCDAAGQLWFYTNGVTVWNGANIPATMPPGIATLNGNPNTPATCSASQGVLIVPFVPQTGANANMFYIFTVSDAAATNPVNLGLSFYTYDALNNVVTGGPFKPTYNSYTTEAITAVPHCNGTDFWIIVKPIIHPVNIVAFPNNDPTLTTNPTFVPLDAPNVQDNSIYAYLVSSNGVSNVPVVSNFPNNVGFSPSTGGPHLNWVSTMKGSPDRNLFAIGERENTSGITGFVNFYRFNCATGGFEFINRLNQPKIAYGISFSPRSGYLYASNGSSAIRRYDMSQINNSVPCSQIPFADIPVLSLGVSYHMQIIGQRIIIAQNGSQFLDEFNTPDLVAPGYVNAFNFPGNPLNGTCLTGLSNNIDGMVGSAEPPDFTSCETSCNRMSFTFAGCATSLSWNFGDGTSISGNAGQNVVSPNTTGTYNDPVHEFANPGSYTVTVTANSMSASHIVNITFPQWNYSTNSSIKNDQGNDIITDRNGDIYVAGTFENTTTFPASCPVTITGAGLTSQSAYIAKFNSCGDLLWVNFDNGTGVSEGTSFALDQTRGVVFLTGSSNGQVKFQSTPSVPCGSPVAGPVNVSNLSPYIAKFDMATGAYIDGYYAVSGPVSLKPGVHIDCFNMAGNSSELYVTYAYNTGGGDQVIVSRLNNTNNSYTTAWSISNIVNPNSGIRPTVNDIRVNHDNSLIYITGEMRGNMHFLGAPVLQQNNSEADAYICAFRTTNGIALPWSLKKLNVPGTLSNLNGLEEATGTCITLGADGGVYFTGYFSQPITGVFGSSVNFPGSLPGSVASYVVRFDNQLQVMQWGRHFYSGFGGAVRATGIALSPASVFITGSFVKSITFPAVFGPNGVYASNGFEKMFVASYDLSGNPGWINTTRDNLSGFNKHKATRIATQGNFTYSTGGYVGNLGYNFINQNPPASGPLNSSPTVSVNTYIIRNSTLFSGSFRYANTDEEQTSENNAPVEIKGTINIYPNPASGQFYIDLGDDHAGNVSIEVYDMMGRKINAISKNESGLISLDLGDQSDGIYLLRIRNGNEVRTARIQILK